MSQLPSHSQLFWLPDGSKYWLISPNHFADFTTAKQVRVIVNSADEATQTQLLANGFAQHQTWFFSASNSLRAGLIKAKPQLNWQLNHASHFQYSRVTPTSLLCDIESVQQLMLGSFVYFNEKSSASVTQKSTQVQDFFSQFLPELQDENTHIFLIRRRSDGMPVGSFTLVFVPFLREIQLHSVAGISPQQTQKISGKLTIILAAAFNHLSHSSFKKLPLTFSCSKPIVQQKYQEIGFELLPKKQVWQKIL